MKRILDVIILIIMILSIQNVNAGGNTEIIYQTHVQDIGWAGWTSNGNISGTTGQSKRIEAIEISLENQEYAGNIEYQTHIQDIGWSNWTNNGNISGTTGQSKRLEAIKIKLTGDISNYYDIYYRVHIQNIGWTNWTSNGEIAGSAGYGYRMEALQISLVKKDSGVVITTGNAYYEKQASITYQTHIQDMGWAGWTSNGDISGTTGQSKRLEAIKINLNNGVYNGSIEYQTHIQNIGWAGWTSNGNINGTTGQSKRLEAIRIKLTGDISNYYDIYYRTHIQNIGWTGWNRNGEAVGSTGYGYRMEALQIQLVKKGTAAPEISENTLYIKPDFNWYYANGVKVLENAKTGIIGTNVSKIIDVSYSNGKIDWNSVKINGDVDGVILRIGYGSFDTQEDSTLAYNISEVKRLGIPYGIYLFSYAENYNEGVAEAEFTNRLINKYTMNPTLGIYLDLESWPRLEYISDTISKESYQDISKGYIQTLNNLGHTNVYLYTGLNYANNRLDDETRKWVNWISQYNNECNYLGSYKMWQYTSSGSISGINGNVDISVKFN